jgi:hypothetical protein
VQAGDDFEATMYEFRPLAALTFISRRAIKCNTQRTSATPSSASRQAGFEAALERRDVACAVTGRPMDECKASHLVPQRLGDASTNEIMQVFEPTLAIHRGQGRHDPRVGLVVNLGLDRFVDSFKLAFRERKDENGASIPVRSPVTANKQFLHSHLDRTLIF